MKHRSLDALINAHRVAYAAYLVEVEYHCAYDKLRKSYHDAFSAQEELFLKICSHRCATPDEERARAKYLLAHPNVTDWWGNATGAKELLAALAA